MDSYELTKKSWVLGDKFSQKAPHHASIQALWETKWKFPCMKGLYPFHDGKGEDFEPIFEFLIKHNIHDGYSDAYTEAFMATGARLTAEGDAATGDTASDLYLRAACVYRIARFPFISNFPDVTSQAKWKAWEAQKAVYLKASACWALPVEAVDIPHTAAAGRDRPIIPLYVRVPRPQVPTVLLMTGLDGYRPDNTTRLHEFAARGWAAVVAEVPGTAECPADPADPESPDRLWTSILDWMAADGRFDMDNVLCWGLSTGGYYAVRVAHTHQARLRGVVAQGAGTHYFFDREWLLHSEYHEYPFAFLRAFAVKSGYTTVEAFLADAQQRFSLLLNGILHKESTRLLLINGTDDGLMPIEDSMLLCDYGNVKEARFFPKCLHMGYPMANNSVYPWMESVLR